MAKPIAPLPGFNTRPLGRVPTSCCGCHSRDTKRSRRGTYYCADCAASFDAYSRSKFGGDERERAVVLVPREGDAACLAVRP